MTLTMPAETLRLTAEQHDAVEMYMRGENFSIRALAGTGKTTSLRAIAGMHPNRRGLYLAFNKSVQRDAERRFQGVNVTCRTAHALAYPAYGRPRQPRLGLRMSNTDRAKLLDMPRIDIPGYGRVHKFAPATFMKVVISTVDRYATVAAPEISADLVTIPDKIAVKFDLTETIDKKIGSDQVERDMALEAEEKAAGLFVEKVVEWAKIVWDDIVDLDGKLPVSHQHYLKMFALAKPQLGFEYILFDEAQDADELMLDVVKSQQNTQLIAVGDENQAIYGWRNAVNALDKIEGPSTTLTQSFRFGQEIADFANAYLEVLGSELRVQGTPGKRSSVFTDHHSYRVPNAIICRSNSGAMLEILENLKAGRSVGIVGERKAEELRGLAQAAVDLSVRGWTNHPDIVATGFTKWPDIVAAAQQEVDDGDPSELLMMISLIEKTGAENIIAAVDSCVPLDQAEVAVGTAHVSKGAEWHHVRIGKDFREPGIDPETGLQKSIRREELRLLYVAVTRAQRHLDALNVAWILDYAGEVID
ncbi:UvrD-helicase domain-containing protein [Agromyces humi]|uniref:UvrD-helicase domain-containing protein n=1 Tax=Agromyces humi TaxID=1766800 RepID=UPI001359B26D|nr:UvrD-helicase domain-containing protein [Agromyces humi]